MPRVSDDEAALLRAICASPDDDLPRLVYADWLDEHGRAERAAFIRLQIDEHRNPGDRTPAGWHRRNAIRELLLSHAADWFRELPRWVRNEYVHTALADSYDRGFIEAVRVVTSPFLSFGDRLLDSYPLRDLCFTHSARLIDRLAACPSLRRLRKAYFICEDIGDDGAEALAASPHLGRLQELDLTFCRIGDRGARALAKARWLGNLSVLSLRGNRLTLDGVKALAASPYLGRRVRFDLAHNPHLDYRDEAVRRLLGDRAVVTT